MNKEVAIYQLYRLSWDWEDEGLNTKLNQTDINAIGIVCSELNIANDKLKKIEEYVSEKLNYIDNAEDQEYILKIIKGDDLN